MTLLDILPSLRAVLSPPVDPARWPHTTAIDPAGRLTIGGVALADIAGEFGTPTHVVDETDFRNRARRYRKELPGTKVLYSDRTPLIPAIARWAGEENLGVKARSGTELATALNGGVHPARIVFHGSAQSRAELSDAVAAGVGRIVVDSAEDVACLAGLVYRTQHVLVRFIPGRRMAATIAALHTAPKLTLAGLHGHIGADITGVELYSAAVRRMVGAMADVRRAHKQVLGELNIGGGHTMTHPELGVRQLAVFLDDALDTACAAERFPRPLVVIAPGRAVIARAGVTLYRVQAVHSHRGRAVVAIEGTGDGTGGSVRHHTALLANRTPEGPARVTAVVGDCDSGDEIVRAADLPVDVCAGDLIAVAGTGGSQHSHGSPVVAVCEGHAMRAR